MLQFSYKGFGADLGSCTKPYEWDKAKPVPKHDHNTGTAHAPRMVAFPLLRVVSFAQLCQLSKEALGDQHLVTGNRL
jgi:hypothetical protein